MEVVTARKGGKRRKYSDKDKAAALALFKANGGNYVTTTKDLGIPISTLEGWVKEEVTHPDITQLRKENEESLESLFEKAARKYLARSLQDEAVEKSSGKDAMITAATATDKMRLLRGESTANVAMQTPADVLTSFAKHLSAQMDDLRELASQIRTASLLEQYGATQELREEFAGKVERGEIKLLTP